MSGPVTINWGDGSAPQDGPEKGDVKHTYTDGDYTATVADKDDPSKKTEVEIHIPMGGSGGTPSVTAAADPADATGRTAKITLAGFPADGAVNVKWGDGTADTTVQAGQTTASHAYATGVEGAQTITATSATDNTKTATTTFTPKPGGSGDTPTVSAAADPADATGRTVKITYSGFPAGTVKVNWGDGTPEETGKPASGELTHPYAAGVEGAQTITLTSEADATKTATASFTPTPGGGGTPTVTAVADPADASGRTVKVTLANFPAGGAVTVSWGDGTADTSVPAGQTTASHPYAPGIEGEQTITATSATDATKTATTTFTPGGGTPAEPTLAAEADPADATGRTVQITLADFPADGAVTVDYGDGTAAVEVPAGTTQATHPYAAGVEGEQTITATSATDQTKTATATFTPGGAGQLPTVTAAADPADATGRTVKVTLAGYPSDSAVNVDYGDGTAAASVPAGTTEASHTYDAAVAGEQTITATSAGDATKTASTTFTPGGGQTPALVRGARKRR